MGTKHGLHRDMKVEDHLINAEEFCSALENLKSVFFRCQEFYGKSHPICKKMWKFASNTGSFATVKSELDDKWHELVDEETYQKYGHVYYGQRRDKKK
tara:strand:+ start:294 stop:587 length:294 start_codon:yes stop_codon:yes gene_type:complete